MPPQYKVLISVLALIITSLLFWLDTRAGGGAARWVALALGPLMVAAIWIFPEPKSKDIRKEAARRR
ncbi:MAG: hypothetical protein R3286_02310 [Gammaproteobacteria bacterium]|nr:hypothetical protein [Gammaproteobacteria bacterium]